MTNSDPLSLDGLSNTEAIERIATFVDGVTDNPGDMGITFTTTGRSACSLCFRIGICNWFGSIASNGRN